MKRRITLSVVIMLVAFSVAAHVSKCPIVKVEAERLADLNTPRAAHIAFCADGELTVVGGHTSGFVPTATAEYYRDGQWHQVPTVYAHDFAMGLPLSSGKVLIAGGQEQSIGIGQTFTVERYDPVTHTFEGFGCMDRKRALLNGIELDSGHVVLTGNWYHDDGIGIYDGKQTFTAVKPTVVQRSAPYVFRTARDNAIILSSVDNRGQHIDSILIDRLKGESFSVPLLQQWMPMTINAPNPCQDAFIGDTDKGVYAYLMPVRNFWSLGVDAERQGRPAGQMAIALVQGENFSLLPTTCPVPMETEIGGVIYYPNTIVADRQRGRTYLTGIDKDQRIYIVAIDYNQRPAPLTLYYTDPLPECGLGNPILTADGNLAFIGGCYAPGFISNNFTPAASAWVIHLDGKPAKEASTRLWWPWALLTTVALLAIAAIMWWRRRRKPSAEPAEIKNTASPVSMADEALMQRIRQLMEQQQLYRDQNLKVSNVAAALGTNSRYVSDCIKHFEGCQFADFIKRYRVDYAKQLLRQQPNKKIASVFADAGFSSESSFFRAFKSLTGVTPKEWMAANHDSQ